MSSIKKQLTAKLLPHGFSDLNSKLVGNHSGGENALIFAIFFNNDKEINLTNSEFDYLIKNSDLNYKDTFNNTALSYLFENQKKDEGVKLMVTKKQMSYLIKNSNLNVIDSRSNTPLLYALHSLEGLKLDHEQLKYLFLNSDLAAVEEKLNKINNEKLISTYFILKEKYILDNILKVVKNSQLTHKL